MEIPAGLLNGLGVVGVVVLMAWLVITGKLVPRNIYLDKVRESEEKGRALATKDEQLAEKDIQLTELAEVGRTVDAVMRAVQQNARRGDDQP